MTEANAKAAIGAVKLTPQAASASPAAACTIGKVVKQDPPAGRTVDETSTVTYTLCSAPTSTIPILAGSGQTTAKTILQGLGLYAKFINVDSSAPQGQVTGSSPRAGTIVNQGVTITVYISKGPRITIPPLRAAIGDEAASILNGLGLVPVEILQPDAGIPAGQVIRTSPAAGTLVYRGTQVQVYVSSGQTTT